MNNITLGGFLTKVNTIFDSCENLYQIEMAKKYLIMYIKKLSDRYAYLDLDDIIKVKVFRTKQRLGKGYDY